MRPAGHRAGSVLVDSDGRSWPRITKENAAEQIVVPPPEATSPSQRVSSHGSRLASQWITAQAKGVHDWAVTAAIMLARASYDRVIDSYPWKDVDAMRARMKYLVNQTVTNLQSGLADDVLSRGNVDAVLPALEGLLPVFDQAVVHREASLRLPHDVVAARARRPRQMSPPARSPATHMVRTPAQQHVRCAWTRSARLRCGGSLRSAWSDVPL